MSASPVRLVRPSWARRVCWTSGSEPLPPGAQALSCVPHSPLRLCPCLQLVGSRPYISNRSPVSLLSHIPSVVQCACFSSPFLGFFSSTFLGRKLGVCLTIAPIYRAQLDRLPRLSTHHLAQPHLHLVSKLEHHLQPQIWAKSVVSRVSSRLCYSPWPH